MVPVSNVVTAWTWAAANGHDVFRLISALFMIAVMGGLMLLLPLLFP